VRLLIYACALLVYAACLAALGSPWACVAAAALSLGAVIAFECIQASQRASEAEDAEDSREDIKALAADVSTNTRDVAGLLVQVAALKRNAALNQVG
jgi:protein-S-isoprenylcysteine O-methyltransferase Ste14